MRRVCASFRRGTDRSPDSAMEEIERIRQSLFTIYTLSDCPLVSFLLTTELLLGENGLMMQFTKGTIHPPGDFTASFARHVSHFMLALHLLLLVLTVADGAWAMSSCSQGDETSICTAPLVARPGEKLQVLSVATGGELEELLVTDPAGRRAKLPAVKVGGPPWSLRGALLAPARGSYRIEAIRAGRVVACAEVKVGGGRREPGQRGVGSSNAGALCGLDRASVRCPARAILELPFVGAHIARPPAQLPLRLPEQG